MAFALSTCSLRTALSTKKYVASEVLLLLLQCCARSAIVVNQQSVMSYMADSVMAQWLSSAAEAGHLKEHSFQRQWRVNSSCTALLLLLLTHCCRYCYC